MPRHLVINLLFLVILYKLICFKQVIISIEKEGSKILSENYLRKIHRRVNILLRMWHPSCAAFYYKPGYKHNSEGYINMIRRKREWIVGMTIESYL